MILVLDASAAVELVTGRPRSDAIRMALADSEYVLAPDLFVSEVANVFWKYLRANLLPEETAFQALDATVELIDEYASSRELYRESLSYAYQYDQSVYDSLYTVLARRNSAILVSLDSRLCAIAEKTQIETLKYDE